MLNVMIVCEAGVMGWGCASQLLEEQKVLPMQDPVYMMDFTTVEAWPIWASRGYGGTG